MAKSSTVSLHQALLNDERSALCMLPAGEISVTHFPPEALSALELQTKGPFLLATIEALAPDGNTFQTVEWVDAHTEAELIAALNAHGYGVDAATGWEPEILAPHQRPVTDYLLFKRAQEWTYARAAVGQVADLSAALIDTLRDLDAPATLIAQVAATTAALERVVATGMTDTQHLERLRQDVHAIQMAANDWLFTYSGISLDTKEEGCHE